MQKILIGGGSGLVGSHLKSLLEDKGYEVFILSRKKDPNDSHIIQWDLKSQTMDLEGLNPSVVINLTGAGIADKPWTASRKKVLIDSRVDSTSIFEKYIKSGDLKPDVFISASAVGIYGDRGSEILDENAAIGDSSEFLVHCCELWENAAKRLSDIVNRLAILRIGLVLSNKGGALEKIKTPVKMGGAAYFGSGKQYYPWIHIDDLCQMFIHIIENKKSQGIYNATGPQPVNMKNFMITLKKHLRSWALAFPVPSIFIKTAMGEMSKILLNSNNVIPQKFNDEGFLFNYETLDEAIKDLKTNPQK